MPQEKVECLEDNFLKWTADANTFFKENDVAKRVLMIILALVSDGLLLSQLYIFTVHGKTWRFPIAITSVYVLRYFLGVRNTQIFKYF